MWCSFLTACGLEVRSPGIGEVTELVSSHCLEKGLKETVGTTLFSASLQVPQRSLGPGRLEEGASGTAALSGWWVW